MKPDVGVEVRESPALAQGTVPDRVRELVIARLRPRGKRARLQRLEALVQLRDRGRLEGCHLCVALSFLNPGAGKDLNSIELN